MTNKVLSETDFFAYKEQLKTYMKGLPRFKDYDFEGSNLSVILDVLAYNTYQNAFYNNMSINEWFMDSAAIDNSVYSHAKTLNYLPRSRVSAAAKISFRLSTEDNPSFITIPAKTKFSTKASSKNFSFYTYETITIFANSSGVYDSGCIDIYEGEYNIEKYFAKSDFASVYRIMNQTVDVNSIKVYVTDSNDEKREFIFRDGLTGYSGEDESFYVQCTDGFYEIYFGQDKFGVQPKKDNIIEIEYRMSNAEEANGVNEFSGPNYISGYGVSPITTVAPASGGSLREDLDSIKFYAPRNYQIKDRAITETDYEIILKNKFPEIQAVSVTGGEDLIPPQYGRVAIYVDTVNSQGISNNIKNKIRDHIKSRTPLAIEPVILSPEFVNLEISTIVSFDKRKTADTSAAIMSLVRNKFVEYSDKYLNKFGIIVRHSDVASYIDTSDTAILSNQTTIKPYVEKILVSGINNDFSINFANPLLPAAEYALRAIQSTNPKHPVIATLPLERSDRMPAVYSSAFFYRGKVVYLRDDGWGKMQIIQNMQESDVVINSNVGTVDYETGKVRIVRVNPDSVAGGILKVYATVKNMDVKIPKSSIVAIRKEDVKITMKAQ